MVHDYPQNLVPPFLLHQVPVSFRPTAGLGLGSKITRKTLVPPFLLHQVPKDFRPAGGPDLVHDYPQNLVTPFPVHQVPVSFRPAAQISPGRRLMKEEKRCGSPTGLPASTFLHLNSKAKRAEQRHGPPLSSSHHHSKRKSNARRPPRITSHHIKKRLTTNAPIVPRSSSILFISSRAGPFLPGTFPPCRPGQTRTLCGGKKLRTVFLRHLLRHFLRHLLRHEHVGTMQLKPASEKQSTPSGPPTIRSC